MWPPGRGARRWSIQGGQGGGQGGRQYELDEGLRERNCGGEERRDR